MLIEKIEIIFPQNSTEEYISALLVEKVRKIHKDGGIIVVNEPIEEMRTVIVGRRLTIQK